MLKMFCINNYVSARKHTENLLDDHGFFTVQSFLWRRGPLILTAPPFVNVSLFIEVVVPPGSLVKHRSPSAQL